MANILLHTLVFPPDGNSNAYIFGDIALELKRLGHNITVITTTPHYSILEENLIKQPLNDVGKRWYKKSEYNGIDCYHINVPSKKGDMWQRLMTYAKFHVNAIRLAWIKRFNADVVISQSPPLSIGVVNYIIAKLLKAKSVYIVQDLFPDGPITQGKIKNKAVIRVLRMIEKSVYKHNDAVTAVSDGIMQHLKERVPKGKILKTIPNFVDAGIYYPMPKNNHMSEKLGVSDKFVISYVGNIGNAHDLSPIFYCAERVKDTNIEFIIAGNGIKKDYYENKAKEENLNNIKFIGYQKREDTPYINALSDICLVMLAPHVKGYSFPSKIYTLMAMAKPIIVMCSPECDAAGFVEKAEAGYAVKCGHCAEFTEIVKELYNNSSKLKQYGENGLFKIKDVYTKETVCMQYDLLIEELCRR